MSRRDTGAQRQARLRLERRRAGLVQRTYWHWPEDSAEFKALERRALARLETKKED